MRTRISHTIRRPAFHRSYSEQALKRTALYNFHVKNGGKMVPFAGYEMPVQYPDGILQSHLWCREKASLFDVSHMGQLRITGKDRSAFLERITVADLTELAIYNGVYSLIPNDKGGIIDDTIITNLGEFIYVVVNAGCFDKDWKHIKAQEALFKAEGKDVNVEVWQDRSLVALQGPAAQTALQPLVKEDLNNLGLFKGGFCTIGGTPGCYVQRSGYTGEDGFEISLPSSIVENVSANLIQNELVKLAGLGARDSLRLEAGLCLYGHDLDEDTSPKQANLVWTISKRRQAQGGFLGDKVILAELASKSTPKRRVGLFTEGPPAREGATVHDPATQEQVGVITSGTFSPILKRGIAMAYIKPPFNAIDKQLEVKVRGKMSKASVTKMPFVPHKYKRV